MKISLKKPRRDETLRCSKRLAAASHPTRLAVLRLLMAKGSCTVSEIMSKLNVEQTLLSHHLQILRTAEVVKRIRDGKSNRYALLEPSSNATSNNSINLGCCILSFK